eukprot:CAMPEP_0171992976 /NCGR_PEP_ID=MMETSP0993-20121228/278212_1 /TAXON_ID=483369 /ORGANISM="non described non described, Strain CCMP2098" /LENGTH=348 /DNA_ID=CAMNT_0012646027 /DNA_START=133 /DNA_END=1180 /DNA_ORIENTATION=+
MPRQCYTFSIICGMLLIPSLASSFLPRALVSFLKRASPIGAEYSPETSVDKMFGKMPDVFEFYFSHGVRYMDTKEFDQARQHFQKALDIAGAGSKEKISVTTAMKAEALCQLGVTLVHLNEIESARHAFETAFDCDPGLGSVADLHHNMATAFKSAGMTSFARAEYQAAIEAEPWRPEPHGHLADLLQIIGDHEGAELELRTAIALCKDLKTTNCDPSPEFFERYELALLSGYLNELSTLLLDNDPSPEFFERYELALLSGYLNELSTLLLDKPGHHAEEALEAHREAVSLAPEEAPILSLFGQAMIKAGKVEEGMGYIALAEAADIREQARVNGKHSHPPADLPADF